MAKFEKGNKIGHRFKKGEVTNPKGRTPLIKNILKKCPADANEKVYDALYTAITMPSQKEALAYLSKLEQESEGEYGIILEMCIRALTGEAGWKALNDILDRLFGKPTQPNETNLHTDDEVGVIKVVDGRRKEE